MKIYVILRRRGWDRAELLAPAGERSAAAADDLAADPASASVA